MPRDERGRRQRTLRDAIVAMYERRLPKGYLDANAGIAGRAHMYQQLEKLRAGETVQLHRFGELNYLPESLRPERTHGLFELRGDDDLVPVPTWKPGHPPPPSWTVPVTVANPGPQSVRSSSSGSQRPPTHPTL
jgi:hypothetical protein